MISTLFRRTLGAFLLLTVVLVAVLVVVMRSGYTRSLDAWSTQREQTLQQIALDVLRGETEPTLPMDVPVFIFNTDRELVVSNRGVGRRRDLDDVPMMEVRHQGRHMGFVAAGPAMFQADTANRALVAALTRAAITGIVLVGFFAVAIALVLARALSQSAMRVAAGIDRIARGEAGVQIQETGAREIRGIAESANLLARRIDAEQQIRAQWVQDVAHDLRSPVASVKAQLEAIADGVHQPDAKRLSRLQEEMTRMETLIGDLDELMRLEAPELSLTIRPVPAGPFLESLRERFEPVASGAGVTLGMTTGADVSLPADEARLYRAVANILANGIRHAARGTEVHCTVRNDGTITVHNKGDVIPPEDLPRLFDRLYRGEYARHSSGSGLGLTIARRIIELHGGTIQITSDAVSGTTVTIKLGT